MLRLHLRLRIGVLRTVRVCYASSGRRAAIYIVHEPDSGEYAMQRHSSGRPAGTPACSRKTVMVERFPLNVNDQQHEVEAGPDMPLLYTLRNDLGLNNPKFGCGLGQCGACTVHIDGAPVGSCVTPMSAVGNGKVVTLAASAPPTCPIPCRRPMYKSEFSSSATA
jgi:ferredoxin